MNRFLDSSREEIGQIFTNFEHWKYDPMTIWSSSFYQQNPHPPSIFPTVRPEYSSLGILPVDVLLAAAPCHLFQLEQFKKSK